MFILLRSKFGYFCLEQNVKFVKKQRGILTDISLHIYFDKSYRININEWNKKINIISKKKKQKLI